MAPLEQAPAVVAALLDQVDLLPRVLPVVADPELARLPVVAQPPGIAQAVGPHLRPGAGAIDERVVPGHAVIPAGLGMIDVDPQHGALQGHRSAGRSAAGSEPLVPSPVETKRDPVVAEGEVAAVVAVRVPLDDQAASNPGRRDAAAAGRPCSATPARSACPAAR